MLVNVSSFRLIVGFALSFNATTWVEDLGFLESFGVYSGALAVVALGLPAVYIYGKQIRAWTSGSLERNAVKDVKTKDIEMDDDDDKPRISYPVATGKAV